ncbi:MAG TPA: CHASE3 domain-containing protein [Alphaproteobacteria bacterium]|nr:CHASE3 domain-containing protein [Alphaproteobacteria bacterium]
MRNATVIAMVALAILMGASAFVFYEQIAADTAARGWVDHTYQVKGHIQALLNKLVDAETGERAFLMSGKECPYHNSLFARVC